MNSGATFERVYDALKDRILGNGFRPGERLDPTRLGSELHSSVTPVRDALHLLTGEGLVETRTRDGFHAVMIDAPALEDLYDWNAEILLLAVRLWPANAAPPRSERSPQTTATAALFADIARHSGNAEHLRAVLSLNDRLQAARACEAVIISQIEDELASMSVLLDRNDRSGLRHAIVAYHRRRHRLSHDLVRALYRQA
jgi:DNA-binding GntR family transcriptional regulator